MPFRGGDVVGHRCHYWQVTLTHLEGQGALIYTDLYRGVAIFFRGGVDLDGIIILPCYALHPATYGRLDQMRVMIGHGSTQSGLVSA